ncbi:MAG TPA: energy-coupling factor ABC transporter substrate-binding protein [Micropepsaceae bacterium]
MIISSRRTNILLLLGVVVLVVVPLVFIKGEYGGSDDQGTAAIEALRPGYKPWFTPIWVPPSPEIESLLFALQAGLGAGVIGYVLGRIHGAVSARDAQKKSTPGNVAH